MIIPEAAKLSPTHWCLLKPQIGHNIGFQKLATTSDSKHQSAPDQYGHEVEHSPRRVWGCVELRGAREMVQKWSKMVKNDVEVAAQPEPVAPLAPLPTPTVDEKQNRLELALPVRRGGQCRDVDVLG